MLEWEVIQAGNGSRLNPNGKYRFTNRSTFFPHERITDMSKMLLSVLSDAAVELMYAKICSIGGEIAPDTPPENLDALIAAAHSYPG